MTAHDRVRILLEYLVEVREGIRETKFRRDGEYLDLMCQAWNEPAYQELERLLPLLRWADPSLYWHVCERWLRYGEVRRAWCRKCGPHPAHHSGRVHAHPPGKAVTLVPRIVRSWHPDMDPKIAERGVEWLASHFRVEPELPKLVMQIEGERLLREAA